jgi:hypothetical protein
MTPELGLDRSWCERPSLHETLATCSIRYSNGKSVRMRVGKSSGVRGRSRNARPVQNQARQLHGPMVVAFFCPSLFSSHPPGCVLCKV